MVWIQKCHFSILDIRFKLWSPWFSDQCLETKNGSSSPFLGTFVNSKITYLEILDLSYAGSPIINSTDLKAISCHGNDDASIDFRLPADGPFTIDESNKFVVIGCSAIGGFTVGGQTALCQSACINQHKPIYCNTYGCCETGIPGNAKAVYITGEGNCGFSTILHPDTWDMPRGENGHYARGHYGMRLGWGIFSGNCSTVRGTSNYSCANAAQCLDAKIASNYSCEDGDRCGPDPTVRAHVCKCLTGYKGNGYSKGTACTDVDECSEAGLNKCVDASEGGICHNLPGTYNCSCSKDYRGDGFDNGTRCTDVDECSEAGLNKCVDASEGGTCHNLRGTYNCSCSKDYRGDGFHNGTRCQSLTSNNSVRSAVIGSISSFVRVSLVACGLFWYLRRRQLKYAGDMNFIENGGIEMQDRIASMGGRKILTMFSEKELKIASNNYSVELGKGGFATVYKGVLSDGTPVAIKKPKSFSNEFINEIVILSHINHRNVVKLIGCCLRTQLPLLVYEFVPNGTLFQHLQSPEKHLSWEKRRQIAIETAEGIAYVHHEASHSIFHRDIKSSNILLDDTFTPKVADFGISRLRLSDDMHLSTLFPSGTPGYVDPEFVRSNQFTEKSDVFSFGVVLVELLTGLQPLLSREGGTDTLYGHFLSAIKGGYLLQILDPKVVDEENQEQMENMAKLAEACLHEEGIERQRMREVVEELVWIRASSKKTEPLSKNVSFPAEKATSTRAALDSFKRKVYDETSSWYYDSTLTQNTSEEPSSSFIQMSSTHAR